MTSRILREATFLAQYESTKSNYDKAAELLEILLTNLLIESNIQFAAITSRAKSIPSIRSKLLKKNYTDPRKQLMDILGIRTILFNQTDVDKVVNILQENFSIRKQHSIDKRLSLGLREFGYRSYHIIANLPDKIKRSLSLRSLPPNVVEIQVRTIFEHSWAEIEHETVYKSGAEFPDTIKRRFASLAAVLELLEQDFFSILLERNNLVEVARNRLQASSFARNRLDTPTLLALLELLFPNGKSFRNALLEGKPFPPRIEVRFLLALRRLRITSTDSLQAALRMRRIRSAIRRYAIQVNTSPEDVSHLAILAIVLGSLDPDLFKVHFPEFSSDPGLRIIF